MTEQDIKRLYAQIMRHEGSVRNGKGDHRIYYCTAGAKTIGYGHNLDANPIPGIGETITEEEAIELLRKDVNAIIDALDAPSAIPWAQDQEFKGELSPARYAVLVNMAFNLGVSGLLGFKNTLNFIARGEYYKASKNMLASKWAKQVKSRAQELARQMHIGEWQ